MPGTKRGSPESGSTARASKVAKTDASQTPSKGKKGAKRAVKVRRLLFSIIILTALRHVVGPQPVIPAATFKATALPLHVNLTHTPPTIADPDTEAVSAATVDPGLIGNLTLVPSTFSTGSYGWKGSKRIVVELDNPETDVKEKLQVMLTINATVLGSKQTKSGIDDSEAKGEDEEIKDEEETATAE
ncbi:hypothetical protein H0H81_008397 [Sphagnurus paluster]|uniref:Uncharacterized protein n=1 Tax=Sphagnurus paluster TaxID=117069 RepID=A0A9P7GK20_9AGAR|nr:hypothetical protein H0H81_008397 [Sphagnurus paluster]